MRYLRSIVVWLVLGRGIPAVDGGASAGAGAALASLKVLTGGVEGGGVEAADEEVDASEGFGVDIDWCWGRRGIGSLEAFAADNIVNHVQKKTVNTYQECGYPFLAAVHS